MPFKIREMTEYGMGKEFSSHELEALLDPDCSVTCLNVVLHERFDDETLQRFAHLLARKRTISNVYVIFKTMDVQLDWLLENLKSDDCIIKNLTYEFGKDFLDTQVVFNALKLNRSVTSLSVKKFSGHFRFPSDRIELNTRRLIDSWHRIYQL